MHTMYQSRYITQKISFHVIKEIAFNSAIDSERATKTFSKMDKKKKYKSLLWLGNRNKREIFDLIKQTLMIKKTSIKLSWMNNSFILWY